MQLILSTASPWNTLYCNENGQALYKAESPGIGFMARTINISRVVPPVIEADAVSVGEAELRDLYEPVGEVDYLVFKHSHIKYKGQDHVVNQFFTAGSYSFYGSNRMFKGPDGHEYVWKLTMRVCKLFRNDHSSETPVALYHRQRLGILKDRRPASLEIFPAGEHMIDLIIVTFIYVEKLRKDRERSTRH